MSYISDKVKSFKAGEALEAGLCVSLSAANTVSLPTADNEDVVGPVEYDQPTAGFGVGVKIDGDATCIAGGTIALGAKVIVEAGGKVIALPAVAGTYNVLGTCMKATTLDKLVEILIKRESVVVV